MFVRSKKRGKRQYLQVVENVRVGKKVRQQVIATLGRLDLLKESGGIDALMRSMERFSDTFAALGAREDVTGSEGQSIGPALVMERLWRELEIDKVLAAALRGRKFEFPVERAVFVTVLHRLFSPGSDRQAERWMDDYKIPGSEPIQLHHFYRAMGWLGSPLPDDMQKDRTPFSERCWKDELEELIFARRRKLFPALDMVFFDTTSLYFEGEGGATIGQHGHSKDHRPDLKQMVVGVILDNEGNPVCTELWPGNTTDVKTLLPIATRLGKRFDIGKVCLVADRGMISQETLRVLDDEKWPYILGARMRSNKEVRDTVLSRAGRYQEVVGPREDAHDPSPLEVKEVMVDGRRYIICRNEEQERKDRADREAIIESLRDALKRGDKSLVGNKGYRKFIAGDGPRFAIDEKKVKEDARYDGKWVLITNTDLSTPEVALKYKQLWTVEAIHRTMKSLLDTRPIFHKCDDTIRGHVWCSFLALLLRKELMDRMDRVAAATDTPRLEWADITRSLDNLRETGISIGGKSFVIRTEAAPIAARVFRACGIALPPLVRGG